MLQLNQSSKSNVLPFKDVTDSKKESYDWFLAIPFLVMQFVPFLAFFTGISAAALVLCGILYVVRMFAITLGYHRYFAHRSYKMNRVVQFLVALIGVTSAQKGPLWWASHHRLHHKYADTDLDIHSPKRGFFWSHIGWIISKRFKQTDYSLIKDFSKFKELVFLNRFQIVFPVLLGILCFLLMGLRGLVVGFGLSTVLLWHGTFAINSIAHKFGRRRYATKDTSKNSFILAVITMGEGWHNNHHNYPYSAKLGESFCEIDFGYYMLLIAKKIGLVKDIRLPLVGAFKARRINLTASTKELTINN